MLGQIGLADFLVTADTPMNATLALTMGFSAPATACWFAVPPTWLPLPVLCFAPPKSRKRVWPDKASINPKLWANSVRRYIRVSKQLSTIGG
jgi:hypothetical protein